MTLTWYYHIKSTKRQVAQFLLFLSGVGILIWQIKNTFQAFIEGQTTFATSQQPHEDLHPPTFIICPKKIWSGLIQNKVNISDDDWYTKEFLLLNDTLTLTLNKAFPNINLTTSRTSSNLTLGKNFDERGKTFFVEKLLNHWQGMCYALTPNQNYKMTRGELIEIVATVANKETIPHFEMYLMDPDDIYEYVLDNLGQLSNGIVAESGIYRTFKMDKIVWNYQSTSKRNCRTYETPDSFATCLMKNQVNCYMKFGQNVGCNCVAENAFWIHFDIHPIQNWKTCRTNSEYEDCLLAMAACTYNKEVNNACPRPCQKVIYKTKKFDSYEVSSHPEYTETEGIMISFEFGAMAIEIHDEVWILETYNFIGSIGGSLGLFIGFSYTGFLGQILDYLFFRNN